MSGSLQDKKLAFCRRELANAEAMVKRAAKLIESLMPGRARSAVNVKELNDWLLQSRRYTGISEDKPRYHAQSMECPNCGEVALRRQFGSLDMYECDSCHGEVLL